MSSPTSPLFADAGPALLAAITEVAENSLFALTDPCDAGTFGAAAAETADGWLRAAVHFNGPAAGCVELAIPEPLARHLAASFAGTDEAEPLGESELADFTGELANMICGTWLTRSCGHQTFSLAPPAVAPHHPDAAATDHASVQEVYLSIDEAPVRVRLEADDAGASERESGDAR